jgi:hypothetical protein
MVILGTVDITPFSVLEALEPAPLWNPSVLSFDPDPRDPILLASREWVWNGLPVLLDNSMELATLCHCFLHLLKPSFPLARPVVLGRPSEHPHPFGRLVEQQSERASPSLSQKRYLSHLLPG